MGKYTKQIQIMTIIIAVLSLISSAIGLFYKSDIVFRTFEAVTGQSVKLYGRGLYANDSISVAAQGIASDAVTMIIGVPLLLIALYFVKKNSFKAKLVLTGTLGYFLYTYMSYTFLWMYNSLFLIYVILMSLSLFSLILSISSFDLSKFQSNFDEKLPVGIIGGFQIFIAVIIGLLWLGKIGSGLINGSTPEGLEHYTTLVIQAMDLGIVLPVAMISGVSIIKRKAIGYLLSSIVLIKGITMLISITAMIVNQLINGANVSVPEKIIFPGLAIIMIVCLVIFLRHTSVKRSECYIEEFN